MNARPTGIHHVSALSAHIDRSHGFFTGVLGMRPVIRTVNQDEPTMYHLFYGDGVGSPGSDMTVFDLPRAAAERPGNHSITRSTLRVAGSGTLEFWRQRFAEEGVPHGEIAERDGRPMLEFADREGMQMALVDDGGAGEAFPWEASPVPSERQIRGLGWVEVTVPTLEPTDRFVREGLGLDQERSYPVDGAPRFRTHVYRMGEGGAHAEVHVVVRDDLPRARYGAGPP
jgi:glyoxalase family protein